VAAWLVLGVLPTQARAAAMLPTMDTAGTYDYAQGGGPNNPGIITFNTMLVQQAQYADASTCTRFGSCDAAVGPAVNVTLIGITPGEGPEQLDEGGDPTLFSSATITISDGSTTFLTGTMASDNWDLSGTMLRLNLTFDLDNLSIISTDNGGSSRFIDEFAAAVAAGAGAGDLPEVHVILNNFNGLDTTTTGQIANVKITSPIPEPSTAALLGLGLVGVGALARRRNRRLAA
jgi:hypothetical protein